MESEQRGRLLLIPASCLLPVPWAEAPPTTELPAPQQRKAW